MEVGPLKKNRREEEEATSDYGENKGGPRMVPQD